MDNKDNKDNKRPTVRREMSCARVDDTVDDTVDILPITRQVSCAAPITRQVSGVPSFSTIDEKGDCASDCTPDCTPNCAPECATDCAPECALDRSITCDSSAYPPTLVREMTVSALSRSGSLDEPPINTAETILQAWIASGKITVEDAENMRHVIKTDDVIIKEDDKEDDKEDGGDKEEDKDDKKPRINSFVVEFMRELNDMLVSLASAFDNEEMPTLHSEIKTINEINEYDQQEAYVRDWHAKLSSVYKTIRVGNEDAFLSALTTVDVLRRVNFVAMYTDSGTDAESRAVLLNYISSLNRDAGLFHGLTPSVMEKLDKLSDMCQDPSTMSLQDIMKVAQNTWATLKPEDMREVGTALPSLFDAVGGEHGITSMLHQYGMIPPGMDMGEMLKRGMSMTQSMGNSSIGELGSSLMSNLSASGLDMGTLASVASSVFGGMTGGGGSTSADSSSST